MITRCWAEGESEKGAMEELQWRGREVGEVLAEKRMVQRKMAAMLGGSMDARPEVKDEMEPDVTSMRMEVRVAGAGRKSDHFLEDQNNNKEAYMVLHESVKARHGRCSAGSRESGRGHYNTAGHGGNQDAGPSGQSEGWML
ncbi:UNVERIFIED_CONTAM: hypothetical protein FKN15_009576 [Acipenser sinensis]